MKITIVGTTNHWNALERHYTKHLRALGADILLFPFADLIYSYYSSNVLRRFLYRYKINTAYRIKKLNVLLIEDCIKNRPDIVWIFKGVNILPGTLLQLKTQGIKLINFNGDHPFLRTFRSSGGIEIEQCVPLYDLHFSYSREIINEISSRYQGKVKTEFLPFGFELSKAESEKFRETGSKEEKLRICFIGNPDNQMRRKAVMDIFTAGLPIDLYGKGWNKYLPGNLSDVNIFEEANDNDYWKVLSQYRVQLNIFRPHNLNSHNMRTFEIPVVGGIQLAPDSVEHREFFEDNQNIFLYNSSEEMVQKAKMLLQLPLTEAQKIRLSANRISFERDYSYRNRAKQVYDKFEQLLNTERLN